MSAEPIDGVEGQPEDAAPARAPRRGPSEDYRVHLDAFEGPLDLLLFLIRRAEVDIHDIPISRITGQYLDYLTHLEGGVESVDVDLAGEFLVMAATLMEIKSRMLTPEPKRQTGDGEEDRRGGDEDEDPRADLVRQLLEYKRYRDASERLEGRRKTWESRYPAGHAAVDREAIADVVERTHELELDEVSAFDLVEAFSRILELVDFNRLGEHTVELDDTPLELHAEDIVDRLTRRWEELLAERGLAAPKDGERASGDAAALRDSAVLPFTAIFEGRSRSEMIGLFLAMLELVRQRKILVRQSPESRDAAAIEVTLGDPDAAMDGDAAATAEAPDDAEEDE